MVILAILVFVVSTVIYVGFNKSIKEKKLLKALLEFVIGISLVVSLLYLFL